MKVIDLLNKIANGKGIPQKIKWGCHILEWQVHHYVAIDDYGKPDFFELTRGISRFMLNDEVEVIEEDKKIEKLEHWIDVKSWVEGSDLEKGLEEQSEFNKNIYYKINEIIDKINEGE